MDNKHTIAPHLRTINCPSMLRSLPGWLVWRFEYFDNETKPRKMPYYISGIKRHGTQGLAPDKAQLVPFEAAKAAAIRMGYDGVGFATLAEFGIVALDFDDCVEPERMRIVEGLVAGTYAEYSPSGQGVRAFMRGNLGNRSLHKTKSADRFGFETFSTKGFVTFTGNRLEITDMCGAEDIILPVTEDVNFYCIKAYGSAEPGNQGGMHDGDVLMTYEPPKGLTLAQLQDALDPLPTDLHYDDWLGVGMAIHHETQGSDEGFTLWDEWSSKSPKYSSTEYSQKKWDSFGKSGSRPVTVRSLLRLAKEHGAHINPMVGTDADFDEVKETVDHETGEVIPIKPATVSSTSEQPADVLRFKLQQAAEFSSGKSPGWIIKGVIPRAELVVVFGESGTGKSFCVLDMCMHIARGESWRGRRTRQGRVVYVCAEGGGGFRNRLNAYAIHHQMPLANLQLEVLNAAPNFLLKEDALDVSRAIVAAGKRADLIVIDTLAQVMPGGNENGPEGAGVVLQHCKGIHRATGATVLLVHHAGKDTSKGARGWSGIRAAADAELEVSRTVAGNIRKLKVTKQKDAEDFGAWGFKLSTVQVGMDDDGDIVDSCVVVEAQLPLTGRGARIDGDDDEGAGEGLEVEVSRKPGKLEALIREVVSEISLAKPQDHKGRFEVELTRVFSEVKERLPAPEKGARDTRNQRIKRALEEMFGDEYAGFYVLGDKLCV